MRYFNSLVSGKSSMVTPHPLMLSPSKHGRLALTLRHAQGERDVAKLIYMHKSTGHQRKNKVKEFIVLTFT